MAAQALYRKWRSQDFDEVVGQEHVTRTLRNALRDGRISHAYLFAGPRGTGKTSTARILAKAVNCTGAEGERPCNQCPICVAVNEGRLLDLIEVDAASHTQVDKVRDMILDKVNFQPSEAQLKFYIIDEVHMLSNSAFNALLKTLEEPPPHVIFVLATTEPHRIPATVLSRCQRFDFRRISVPEIATHLAYVLAQEGYRAEPEALHEIARAATGSMRDALSLLDQLLAYGHEEIAHAHVRAVLGTVGLPVVIDLVDCLAAQDVSVGLDLLQRVVTGGVDPREFASQVVVYLRGLMLVGLNPSVTPEDVPPDAVESMRRQAQTLNTPTIVRAIRLFNQAVQEVKLSAQPQLPLELALVEAIQPVVSEPTTVQHLPPEAALPVSPASAGASKPAPTPRRQVDTRVESQTEETRTARTARTARAQPAGSEGLDLLKEHWGEISARLRQRRPTLLGKLSARSGVRFLDVSDGDVWLGYQNKGRFLAEKIEGGEDQRILEEVLSEVLGAPHRLRVIAEAEFMARQRVVRGEKAAQPSVETGERADDDEGLDEDPVVREALRLGGVISEHSS